MKKKQEIPEEVREKEADSGQQTADSAEAADATAETEASADAAEEKSAEAESAAPETLAEDVAAFHDLFPDVKAEDIPGEVWDQVEAGTPLAAAFAVHFVKAMRERARIEEVNAENEKTAPPPVRHDGKEESYFSPEAVRRMSRAEVREHYREILRSMDHWD